MDEPRPGKRSEERSAPGKSYDPLDPQVQFRILTKGNITGGYKPGWYDVATANFHASEFAADLYKVASGGEVDAHDADPVEFFKRTYKTEGLRDLIA